MKGASKIEGKKGKNVRSGRYRTVTSNESMRFEEFWPPAFSLLMLQVGW